MSIYSSDLKSVNYIFACRMPTDIETHYLHTSKLIITRGKWHTHLVDEKSMDIKDNCPFYSYDVYVGRGRLSVLFMHCISKVSSQDNCKSHRIVTQRNTTLLVIADEASRLSLSFFNWKDENHHCHSL